MEKEYDVIVAGLICFDMIPTFVAEKIDDFASFFLPGKLINANRLVTSPGGPVSNTGLNLKQLGFKVGLMGKIGTDFIGTSLRNTLKQMDAHDGLIIADEATTAYTVVIIPPGIDRIFLHHPGANSTYCAEDVNYDQVARSRVFHLGYPPLMRKLYSNRGEELIKIFRKVKTLDSVATGLDMSLPDPASESATVDWNGLLKELIPEVDLFLPSAEECMFMLDKDRFFDRKRSAGSDEPLDHYTVEDFRWMGERLLDYGAKVLVIKSGYKGAYVRTAGVDAVRRIPGVSDEMAEAWAGAELWSLAYKPPKFGSAAGSGDSFIAGFLSGFLKGMAIEDAVTIANCVGCQNVTEVDTLTGIRTWDETLKMIHQIPRNEQAMSMETDQWDYDKAKSLWRRTRR